MRYSDLIKENPMLALNKLKNLKNFKGIGGAKDVGGALSKLMPGGAGTSMTKQAKVPNIQAQPGMQPTLGNQNPQQAPDPTKDGAPKPGQQGGGDADAEKKAQQQMKQQKKLLQQQIKTTKQQLALMQKQLQSMK